MLTFERLQTVLKTFPRMTIGLVGDLFLDRYLHLAAGVHETSIETGEEAYQIDRVRNSPVRAWDGDEQPGGARASACSRR